MEIRLGLKSGSSSKRVVDFRSDWALCCCRFAFAQLKHLPLPLRFRAAKTFAADASLSRRAELPGGVR